MNSLWQAGIGPVPMIAGSTPAEAQSRISAIGLIPSSSAFFLLMRTSAQAASLIPEALPAVTVPSFVKAGFNLARPSIVVSGRICSSFVMTISPFLRL